ncbi:MAG: FKBP-type peptidyl-prolyl cis-trans isomerase [Clostridia bacterium]|nr:FKBP-type peptidyl-prolyl cis-trans isomerase [Clostridia bacterium]
MKRKLVTMIALMLALLIMSSGCADSGRSDNGDGDTPPNSNGDGNGSGNGNENGNENGDGNGAENSGRFDYDLTEYITLGSTNEAPDENDVLDNMLLQFREASKSGAIAVIYDADGEEGSITDIEGISVCEGDTVNIDYVGRINGVAFQGGTDSGYDLTIGSGAFIPGFESGLIGAAVEATVDVNVVFPEDYYPDLAGQPAVFTVKINSLTRYSYPEMNEENVEKYMEITYSKLKNNIVGALMFQKLYEDSQVLKYPEDEIGLIVEDYVSSVEGAANYYGVSLETYLATLGHTEGSFFAYVTGIAQQYVKQYLVIYSVIAEYPQLKMSEDEYVTESRKLWSEMVEIGDFSGTYESFCSKNQRFDIETSIYTQRVIEHLSSLCAQNAE